MIAIENYILQSQADRQKHLKLDEPCIERGGMSSYCKGLMAHIHNTTIPSGKKIHVCHACHNAKCSNPNHLYWGTPSENRYDAVANGLTRRKTSDELKLSMARFGNQNAKGLKGRPKSEEHKKKIAEAIARKYKEKMAPVVELADTSDLGSDI